MSHTPPPGIPVNDDDQTTERAPVAAPEPWTITRGFGDTEEVVSSLTVREREVASMLCRGMKNAEIAEAMGISIKTVDTHRGHVLSKLEVRNNVELLRLAIRKGWHVVEVSS